MCGFFNFCDDDFLSVSDCRFVIVLHIGDRGILFFTRVITCPSEKCDIGCVMEFDSDKGGILFIDVTLSFCFCRSLWYFEGI